MCTLVMSVSIVFAGGEFGAMMQVHIQNDGPVTLQFETPYIPPPKEVYKLNYQYHCIEMLNILSLLTEKAQQLPWWKERRSFKEGRQWEEW